MNPEYPPQTVNTDGWGATRRALLALFPTITIMGCFLHAFIAIRSRCRKKWQDAWPQIQDWVWQIYEAETSLLFLADVASFESWAKSHVSEPALKSIESNLLCESHSTHSDVRFFYFTNTTRHINMSNNSNWNTNNIPDLSGKTAVITGANSGIGLEAAKALAAKGAHIVMACRNVDKATAVQKEIPGTSEVISLNLASLDSIETFSRDFHTKHQSLDLLINNAGVMAPPYQQTADRFEMQFGTNHLGHFALTGRLLDTLLAVPHSRVVSVSSGAHAYGKGMEWDNIDGSQRYSRWGRYCMSKLANLLFAYELDRKFKTAAATTLSVVCHPGYAATNLQTLSGGGLAPFFTNLLMRFTNRFVAQSAEMGALPTLYAAVATDIKGGEYIGPEGMVKGYPRRWESNKASRSLEDAARLWNLSEQLTGISYAGLT